MVTAYTVSGLRPSNDVVNAPVAGRLWEATTTVDAVQGTVTPAIPFLNARTDNGQNYGVLFQAAAPQGLNGAPVPRSMASQKGAKRSLLVVVAKILVEQRDWKRLMNIAEFGQELR